MELNKLKKNFNDCIGNTPLIRLKLASEISGCNIYGKCEFLNPGGSVKDRPAFQIDQDALDKKMIKVEQLLRGLPVILVLVFVLQEML